MLKKYGSRSSLQFAVDDGAADNMVAPAHSEYSGSAADTTTAFRHNSRLLICCACQAGLSWMRQIVRTVSAIEDNIEARYSVVHCRSPAPAKIGSCFKSKRAIV